MFGRGWIFFFLLGGALIPYLLSSKSTIRDVLTSPLQMMSKPTGDTTHIEDDAAAPHDALGRHVEQQATSHPVEAAAHPQVAAPQIRTTSEVKVVPFEQALRWEVKPAWVLSTWSRVTTALPELDLQGYRVAYVSGTAETDIAGSLSYYFDNTHELRRIEFQGTTGDARRLVQFLTSQHRFERRLSDDPSTYLYQVPGGRTALSEMRIKTAAIVSSGSPLSRFGLTLEMRRPE